MGKEENSLKNTIMDMLIYKRNCFAWGNNTGAYKVKNRFVKYGYPGSPDILAVIEGRFVGIETKVRGRKQSANQIDFQQEFEAAGGIYILARSMEDVLQVLESHGL